VIPFYRAVKKTAENESFLTFPAVDFGVGNLWVFYQHFLRDKAFGYWLSPPLSDIPQKGLSVLPVATSTTFVRCHRVTWWWTL